MTQGAQDNGREFITRIDDLLKWVQLHPFIGYRVTLKALRQVRRAVVNRQPNLNSPQRRRLHSTDECSIDTPPSPCDDVSMVHTPKEQGDAHT